jgi:hypothetical protein
MTKKPIRATGGCGRPPSSCAYRAIQKPATLAHAIHNNTLAWFKFKRRIFRLVSPVHSIGP